MYDELTQVDIDKMKAELEHRRLELRPKLIEDVQTARAFGDLSENYEYKVAKQEKNRNESRIRYLERMIATAKVIEVNEKEGTVGLFDHVVLFNEKLGKEQNIQLVTTLRQNALKGLISKESPVGKAILGKKVGDLFRDGELFFNVHRDGEFTDEFCILLHNEYSLSIIDRYCLLFYSVPRGSASAISWRTV